MCIRDRLGKDGDETITMEQLGELSGRFNYEFACLIDVYKRQYANCSISGFRGGVRLRECVACSNTVSYTHLDVYKSQM